VAAFRASVAEAGPPVNGSIFVFDGSQQALVQALQDLKRRAGRQPAAVTAGNAVVSLAVAGAVAALGWRFGQDIGFVGIDDPDWAAVVGNGLTAIAQPTDDIGRVAASCLIERLQGRQLPARQILLNGRLMPRASSRRGK
jgi:LacI family kdg operon repressor